VYLERVSKEYRRARIVIRALSDITLCVPDGQFCAIVGPSGCGKSTLLTLMAGFDVPSSGEIVLDGRSTKTFTDADWTAARRRLIGVVFQAFYLVPGLTAHENIALPLRLQGEAEAEIRRRADEALELVALGHRRHHRMNELSGGEQQRVAIARALIHRPRLILADEPTGNLDSKTGESILALLQSLRRRFGHTIVMATHSSTAAQQAERVVFMEDGRLQDDAGRVR
jgi:ABC-type lipoprotein export system ATPase subunit